MTDKTAPDALAHGAAEENPTEESSAAAARNARERNVLWVLLVATFVVILNETIMNVALRTLQLDLGIDERSAQWLSTAFMLTMAVVIPVTGFLLQRFTTRRMFIVAMTLFSIGTLLASLAPGFEVLLGARIIQASGTAIMMPLLMTTLMTVVPPAERGKTMGNVSIVISVAPAIGPIISGLVLSLLSWRWMFWIVLPIALAMLVLGARRLENVGETRRAPIDVFSVVLSAFGFGGLVYGLSRIGADAGGGADASSTLPMWIALGVGAVGLASFIVRQLLLQRRDRALLDLRVFRSRNFTFAIAMMAISMMALFGTLIVLPIYMQEVLALPPWQVGLVLLPGGLTMGLLAPWVGRLYDKVGPRLLLVPGAIVVSAVLWMLTTVSETTSPWFVVAMHVSLSIGLAFLFTPLFSAGLGSVAPTMYSHGSAVIGTVQQVAGASGAALFITLMATQSGILSAAGVPAAAAAAGGVRAAFLAGAIISLGGIVAAFFVRKPVDSAAHGGH